MIEANILIVEDDSIAAYALEKTLRLKRFSVIGIVSTGEEAINFVIEKKPSLVLMDINLRGTMDGIETAKRIRENYNIPIIYLTAFSDEESIKRASSTHPAGYLVKPYDNRDLETTIEITLYKHLLEKKEKESQVWYRETLSSIGDGIIATDKNDLILFINNKAEELTGFSLEEATYKKIDEIYRTSPDMTTEAFISYSQYSRQDIEKYILQSKLLNSKSGIEIPIEEKVSFIKDEEGQILGKVITFRDSTQRRELERELIIAKDFYLNILEKFPLPIWRANTARQFNYFNQTWLDFTGKPLDDQVFSGWFSLIHDNDRDKFIQNYETCFDKKEKLEIEFRLLGRDAEYHWLICDGNPIYDLKGNFNGFIGVCLDITNRKILEDELRTAKDISEELNKSKSAFISVMSHEIRTPLNGIMGLTDLLYDTNPNNEQLEYLELLKESSHTLLSFLNNLLDYTKIEDKKEKLDEDYFNLRQIIEEIIKPISSIVKRNGIKVTLEIDERLPESIFGDSKKIKQIAANLLSNSVKFTENGSIDIKIFSDCRQGEKKEDERIIHFVFSDTGIGIPEDKLDSIFDSFTQVDSSLTRKFSGSGLGLSIVKNLVNLMNGKIWVESQLRKGTSFHVVLQLKLENKSNGQFIAPGKIKLKL